MLRWYSQLNKSQQYAAGGRRTPFPWLLRRHSKVAAVLSVRPRQKPLVDSATSTNTRMSNKVIQEQFGQAIIDAMASFAKKDIKDVAALEADEFSHVSDPAMRTALAETLYGTRWLYKLGLALLANNQEQFAHVRAQIIDYASVSEALRLYAVSSGN